MLLQSALKIIGDARIERTVTAPENVKMPFDRFPFLRHHRILILYKQPVNGKNKDGVCGPGPY
jgi:hypothetical protein